MKPSKNALYLTPEEVATLLRVDVRTVYNLLRTKKLPGVKFGHSWRILARDVKPEA